MYALQTADKIYITENSMLSKKKFSLPYYIDHSNSPVIKQNAAAAPKLSTKLLSKNAKTFVPRQGGTRNRKKMRKLRRKTYIK